MKLFVDDIRTPPNTEVWQIARNVTSAIGALKTGFVDEVSLDHDIQCKHPECYMDCILEDFSPVAEYIALMPIRPIVHIHTGNVVAGKKMADILGIPYNNEIYNENNYK